MPYNSPYTGAEVDDAIARSLHRAFVNFNGTGTPAINASYNVSSISDYGSGYFGVNFTNSLSDAHYAAVTDSRYDSSGAAGNYTQSDLANYAPSTSAFRIFVRGGTAATLYDPVQINAIVAR